MILFRSGRHIQMGAVAVRIFQTLNHGGHGGHGGHGARGLRFQSQMAGITDKKMHTSYSTSSARIGVSLDLAVNPRL